MIWGKIGDESGGVTFTVTKRTKGETRKKMVGGRRGGTGKKFSNQKRTEREDRQRKETDVQSTGPLAWV